MILVGPVRSETLVRKMIKSPLDTSTHRYFKAAKLTFLARLKAAGALLSPNGICISRYSPWRFTESVFFSFIYLDLPILLTLIWAGNGCCNFQQVHVFVRTWDWLTVSNSHGTQSSEFNAKTETFVLLRSEYEWRNRFCGCTLSYPVVYHFLNFFSSQRALRMASMLRCAVLCSVVGICLLSVQFRKEHSSETAVSHWDVLSHHLFEGRTIFVVSITEYNVIPPVFCSLLFVFGRYRALLT